MITFTEFEARWLGNMREQANASLAKMVAALQKGLEQPGEIAYRLGWDVTDMAYQDHLRRHLAVVLDDCTQEDSPATLENVIDHYTREVIRWQPQHSTNPTSNTVAEMEQRAKQYLLEQLCSIKQSRLQDEAKAKEAPATPVTDTKKAKKAK